MTNSVFLKPGSGPVYEWLTLTDDIRRPDTGDLERLVQACAGATVILLAPAELVTVREIEFEAAERKLLAQTIRYGLEEDINGDVDELHFAMGKVADNRVPVAVIGRDQLVAWLAPFTEQGIEIGAVIPEQLLVPWADESWTLLADDQRCLVRHGEYGGFALERSATRLGLQLLLNEVGLAPARVTLYADAADQELLAAELPELLRANVDQQDQVYWQAIAQNWQPGAAINLLQGEFVRSLPWLKWWQAWRIAAIVALVAVALQLVVSFAQVNKLEDENLALRAQTEKVYRQVVPRGKIVDPERQLRRKVDALRGQSSEGFTRMFFDVAKVIAAADGVALQSMTYNDNRAEINLTLLAGSFREIETIRTNIEKQDMKAELTGSSNDGGKTRARLRVKG